MISSAHSPRLRRLPVVVSAFLGLTVATLQHPSQADDRDLFRAASTAPLVMTILDTSASMHLKPDGSFAPAGADDPDSRFYQAKSALWEVIDDLGGDLIFGWAHLHQVDLQVQQKRWLYNARLTSGDPSSRFAPTGGPISFGPPPSGFTVGRCSSTPLAASSMETVELFPKEPGDSLDVVLPSGETVRFTYTLLSGSLGDENLTLTYAVTDNPGCGTPTGNSELFTVQLSPYRTQDNDGRVFPTGRGFDYIQYADAVDSPFGLDVKDYTVDSACLSGRTAWLTNENPATSALDEGAPDDGRSVFDGGNPELAYDNFDPTNPPDTRACSGKPFRRGDIVPLDWIDLSTAAASPPTGFEFGARQEVLYRLAPNTVPGLYGESEPDFRIARYFENDPAGGSSITLDLATPPLSATVAATRYPPIMTGVGTPLAGVLGDMADYFEDGFTPCAEDETDGDERFPCRQRYLILVTDGAESCLDPLTQDVDAAVTAAADRLFDLGFKIFVIGFGADATADQLDVIADAGGTGSLDADGDGTVDCEELSSPSFDFCPGPLVASNYMELVDALDRAFGAVQPNPATFSSANAPEASAETDDSIFLSTFVPVDDAASYPGKLLHFIRPLPLTQDASGRFVADENETCADDEDVGCLAWEADAVMRGIGGFDQVPSLADAQAGGYQLGSGTGERRLYYAIDPGSGTAADDTNYTTRLLTPPTPTSTDESDLWFGLGKSGAPVASEIESIIAGVVAEQDATNPADSTEVIDYILPDFFHSNPELVGAPDRAEYLLRNLPDGSSLDCTTSKGYRCFFEKHRYRRRVLLAGGSDGQLHAFDAGTFDSVVNGGVQEGEFNRGSGQELFSFVPRALLPRLLDFEDQDNTAPTPAHDFALDNTLRIDDVFIDPEHDGTPTTNDREWRTVGIGTLREGGRSVFALDLTQPDTLAVEGGVQVPQNSNYVPECMDATGYTSSGCGSSPYGAVLWEFTDQCDLLPDPTDCAGGVADEDGNLEPDLGYTWSRPNTGLIKIKTSSNSNAPVLDRFVAIFGGGLLPDGTAVDGWDPDVGDWLYMVDIETGKTLYKRQLDGPTPSPPAAVDTNRDGVLDTVYIGTVAGSMFKVDLSTVPVLDSDGRVPTGSWEPVRLFTTCDLNSRPSTNDPTTPPDTGCPPIFYAPTVFFAQDANGLFALAFGTGDRADLFNRETEVGWYYSIVDCAVGSSPCSVPLIPGDFPDEVAASNNDFSGNPLFTDFGYRLELAAGEKLVSQPFVVGGITVFNTFLPSEEQELAGEQLCFFKGVTNIYSIFTASGNPLAANGGSGRYRSVEGLASDPFSETTGRAGEGDGDDGGQDTEDEVDDDLQRIRDELKTYFPDNCRFTNVSIDIKALRSDTGIEFIAPVPVCVVEKNWREF